MEKKKKNTPEISKEEFENLKNQLVRALADYDNLRKRVEKEKAGWVKMASEIVVIKLLPVLDTLESAQVHLNDQGLGIAITQFKEVLKDEGLEEIRPNMGDGFNADFHEAIESVVTEGGEKEKGKIAELVLPGWKFKELPPEVGSPVVRYAKVKVYGDLAEKEKVVEKESTI